MVLDIKAMRSGAAPSGINKTKKKEGVSSLSSFAVMAEDMLENNATTPLQANSSLNALTVDHLLTISTLFYDASQKTLQHGHDILNTLDYFRTQLIKGEVPIDTLQALSNLLTQNSVQSLDPTLQRIIEDVRIRAEVELAKWSIKENGP